MRSSRNKNACARQERGNRSFTRKHSNRRSGEEVFKCRHCRRFIGPLPYGGYHRNHCPFCLYSRHVDNKIGDRLSECGSRMQPIGYFQRPNGEYVLVHRCLGCDFERSNRIAADDNFELVLSLPALSPHISQETRLFLTQPEERQELEE